MALPRALRSLAIRNYRLWFTGMIISMAGSWAQVVAQALVVLRLSGDNGVAAGGAVAAQYLPTLLFGMWGGLLADRFDKRTLLIATQIVQAVPAFVLAALDATGAVRLWSVYALAAVAGLATAVEHPTRQSLAPELVAPEDLPNAVGLQSTVINLALVVGPSLAAGVIAVSGTAACFLLNGLSYLGTLIALLLMRPSELRRAPRLARAKGQVRAGIRYAWSEPVLRSTLLMMAVVGTLGFNANVVLPLIAKVTFHGGAGTVSAVFVAQGIGAVIGAFTVASLPRADGRRLALSAVALGVAMCAAAPAPTLLAFLPLMVVVGVALLLVATNSAALIQLESDPGMRGRVTSLRSLTVLGSAPLGGVISGAVAQLTSPRWALAVGGVGCFLGLALAGPLLRDRRPLAAPAAGDAAAVV